MLEPVDGRVQQRPSREKLAEHPTQLAVEPVRMIPPAASTTIAQTSAAAWLAGS